MEYGRWVAAIVLVCMVSCMGMFYTKKRIDPEELHQISEPSIHSVVTIEGDTVEFEPPAALRDTMVVGITTDSATVKIPLSQVHYVNVRKIDELKLLGSCSAGLLGAVLGAVLAFYLLIWIRPWN